jgi:ABC-type dipeptide/oligopeptide/nickel transport system permease component
MLRYAVWRLLSVIPVILAVLTIVFIVVPVIPGDPATAALGDFASKEAVQELRQRMGLNEPLPAQYVHFLGNLFRGDLGRSMLTSVPVRDRMASVLPLTLELTLLAIGAPLIAPADPFEQDTAWRRT